jgi:LPS-assembly protein
VTLSTLPQLLFDGNWPPTASSGFAIVCTANWLIFSKTAVTGTRLDLWPTVGWSLDQPWGYLKPEAGFRYTGYQLANTAPNIGE